MRMLVRVFRSKRMWIAVTLGVAAIAVTPALALASPGSGVAADPPLVTANFQDTVHVNSDRVKFQTKDATDVRIQRQVFAAGSYSGWHHHPGVLMVAVLEGAVTLTDSACNSVTYGPGEAAGAVFVEGGDEPIQASSVNGATVYVTYGVPDGSPFRVEDPVQSCP